MQGPPNIPGYRILRELAAGSSGVVYLALQESLDREVALKVLSPGLFDAEETRARFLREAKAQASLAHANLLRVFDAGFAGKRPYLAMELVEGGSLRDRLDGGALSPREALLATASIASGLAHAHENGIVHRDLKPENALLTRDGQIKVADFGLAKMLSSKETVQTATGVILGTPGYIAPEVLRGQPAGPKADVYALGVILFECLAGRRPFEGPTLGDVLSSQMTTRAPSLASEIAGAPPGADELVRACTEAGPAGRPTAAEVATELSRIAPAASSVRPAALSRLKGSRVEPAVTAQPTQTTGPIGLRPKSSTTRVATVPPRPAGGSHRTAVAAAAVLGALAAFALHPRATPPAARVIASPSVTPLATLERVTEGADRVKIRLSGPARGGERVIYRSAGGDTVRTFASGAVEVSLGPLAPATEYDAQLDLGAGPRPIRFRTMPALPSGLAALNALHTLGRGLIVLETADSLVAVWRVTPTKRKSSVQFRESFDGGNSWTPALELSHPDQECSWPSMVNDARGLTALWETNGGTWGGAELRHRPAGTRKWGEPIAWPATGKHEPSLAAEPDGAFTALSWRPGDGTLPGIRIARIPWGGPATVEPSTFELPHFDSGARCCSIARASGRLFCVFMHESDPGGFAPVLGAEISQSLGSGVETMYTWRAESGSWAKPGPLSDPKEKVSATPDVVGFRGKLFACYDAQGQVCVRSVDPTAGAPSSPWRLEGSPRRGSISHLRLREGKLLLAYAGFSKQAKNDPDELVSETSADGVAWEVVDRRPVHWEDDHFLRIAYWKGQPVLFASDFRERIRIVPARE